MVVLRTRELRLRDGRAAIGRQQLGIYGAHYMSGLAPAEGPALALTLGLAVDLTLGLAKDNNSA